MATVEQLHERKQAKTYFRRILIATDFSAPSRRALDHALAIARRYDSEISVVHAIPREPREPIPMDPLPKELDRERLQAEQEIRRLEQEAHLTAFAHRLVVEQGSVWEVLSSMIRRDCPDLLVLGTRGRGGLKKLALGSVAEEVLRLATCPVLTVGPKTLPPKSETADFKSIVFATDFGEASDAACPYALSLAEDCKAKLILVHMLQPMAMADVSAAAYGPATYGTEDYTPWLSRTREESRHKLEQLIPSTAKLASPPVCLVETSFLPGGILDTAIRYHADLIVMGANPVRSPRLAAHIPWAITHEVLGEASCPVLTVRS